MSGAEAIAVLGVISSIISIVDGIKQVYSAASNAKGLPEAFAEVATRLPVVQNILEAARGHINDSNNDTAFWSRAKDVVASCEIKTKKLDKIFQEVIPADDASKRKKYLAAVKTLGKGSRVETLMKGILDDVQLLAVSNNLIGETDTRRNELAEAIRKVAALPPSLPEDATDETGFTAIHSGSGGIYQSQGDQFNNPGSGHVYHAQTMNFGSSDLNGDETQACLRALFRSLQSDPRDDRDKLIHRKDTRVDGTCIWIKSNENYQKWLQSQSELLWISGGPGKGKTMLSIFLAQELEQTSASSPDAVSLEFFCDSNDDKRNTADALVRAFKIQQETLFSGSSILSLWKVFQAMVCEPDLGPVYCILDGLDECDETSLDTLLRCIKELFSIPSTSSHCKLKLIIVSRELPEIIPDHLESFARVKLDPDANGEVNQDIYSFIDAKVAELSSHRKYPNFLKEKVRKVFQDRAQGTFLWVGIVAKTLTQVRATEVEEVLDLFPSGLQELFTRMIIQIPIDRRGVASKIIRWVVMTARPLSLSELSVIIDPIAQSPGKFDREEVIRGQISYCGYFLSIQDRQVYLIHSSAKDYLLRKERNPNPNLEAFRIDGSSTNSEIARYCFNYLQNGSLTDGALNFDNSDSRVGKFPMLAYAVEFWHVHARSLAPSHDIFDLSLPFYQKHSLLRDSWLQSLSNLFITFGIYHPDSSKILHIAAALGITPLAKRIFHRTNFMHRIKSSRRVKQKDGINRTALHWAAWAGNKEIVQLLLDNNADPNAKDHAGITSLTLATCNGNKAVLQILIANDADIEAKDEGGRTPLNFAVISEGLEIIQVLLKQGANIEAQDNEGWSALHIAALHGNKNVIRLLLENGANIEARSSDGLSPSHIAVHQKDEASIRLLLEKGANIEAQNGDGSSPLYMAVWQGDENLVRLLLENGAKIEAQDRDGSSALHIAVFENNENLVRLLLENGASTQTVDRNGQTALDMARDSDYKAILQLLRIHTTKILVILSSMCRDVFYVDHKSYQESHRRNFSESTMTTFPLLHTYATDEVLFL